MDLEFPEIDFDSLARLAFSPWYLDQQFNRQKSTLLTFLVEHLDDKKRAKMVIEHLDNEAENCCKFRDKCCRTYLIEKLLPMADESGASFTPKKGAINGVYHLHGKTHISTTLPVCLWCDELPDRVQNVAEIHILATQLNVVTAMMAIFRLFDVKKSDLHDVDLESLSAEEFLALLPIRIKPIPLKPAVPQKISIKLYRGAIRADCQGILIIRAYLIRLFGSCSVV